MKSLFEQTTGMGCIYALCEPDTFEIRYVGQTTQPLKKRLRQHISEGRKPRNYRGKWIAKLLQSGATPTILVLDEVLVNELDKAEMCWISNFRLLECRLVNGNDGGGGNQGIQMSTSTRAQMSASAVVRCAEAGERKRLKAISGSTNDHVLDDESVAWIRQQSREGVTASDLGLLLGVTKQAVWKAATGKTWKQVEEPERGSLPRQKLSITNIQDIILLRSAGHKQKELAARYKVTQSQISRVLSSRSTMEDF